MLSVPTKCFTLSDEHYLYLDSNVKCFKTFDPAIVHSVLIVFVYSFILFQAFGILFKPSLNEYYF